MASVDTVTITGNQDMPRLIGRQSRDPFVRRGLRLAVPAALSGTVPWRVIVVSSTASVVVRGGSALARRRGRVCPRSPGPAACTERGDLDGFASSPGSLLRRVSGRRPRSGQRQLANGFHASGAPVLHVRGLRLHLREGAHRGAAFRPATPSSGRRPEAANQRPARRMTRNAPGMSTMDTGGAASGHAGPDRPVAPVGRDCVVSRHAAGRAVHAPLRGSEHGGGPPEIAPLILQSPAGVPVGKGDELMAPSMGGSARSAADDCGMVPTASSSFSRLSCSKPPVDVGCETTTSPNAPAFAGSHDPSVGAGSAPSEPAPTGAHDRRRRT